MTKQRTLIAALFAVLLAVFVFGGERFYQSNPAHKPGYSSDMNTLRKQFNSDKDKVRLLMLLSPT